MNWRNAFSLAFALMLVVGLLPALGLAQEPALPSPVKVDPLIYEQLSESPDGKTDYFIEFSATADLSPAYGMNWHDRGYFVVETLQATAETSQANVKTYLQTSGIEYTSFWIDNSLFVHAGEATINALASFPEVSGFRANHVYQIFPEEEVTPPAESGQILAPAYPWNITFPMADMVHSSFGIRGQGIVVGGMDTGVEHTHPSLVTNYRGNLGGSFDHTYSWYDPSNACGGTPCDTHGHGIQTMGIMAGDDDPSLPDGAWIGMAPDAEWIHCLGCPNGSCASSNTIACAQWFLAPGNDPGMRPHVVNHSWGSWSPNDCNGNAYQSELLAYRAADILPAFAAGNVGDWVSPLHCNASTSPANNTDPAGNPIAFATGAHGPTGSIDSYSSGGPSACNTANLFPDVAAPGSGSCTTYLGNTYTCSFGGTSSASPHTAGCVALVRSANSSLSVAEVEQIIRDAANDVDDGCGTPPETPDWNNIYGEGQLDCYEAVQLAMAAQGMLDFAPPSIHVTLDLGDSTTEPGVLYNVGGGDANFEILEFDGGHSPLMPTVTGPALQGTTGPIEGWDPSDAPPEGTSYTLPKGPVPEAWGAGTPIPTGAQYQGAGVTIDNENFYLIGGYNGIYLNQNLYYDVASGTWDQTLTPMPTARGNIMAYYNPDDGLIYVPGGWTGVYMNQLEAYDPAGDTWTTLSPLPIAKSGANGGIVDGRLYLFGGNGGGINETQIYDIATDSWYSGTPMPGATHRYGANITYQGYIYVIAGYGESKFYRYDPATDTWQAGPSLNLARNSPEAAISPDGIIYAWGGGDGWTPLYDGEYYDLAAWPGGSWTSIAGDNIPQQAIRAGHACASDHLWAEGGADPSHDGNQYWDGVGGCYWAGALDVPWLSEDPISGTVPADDSIAIDVSFDAGVPQVSQPGDYYATLRFDNDTPFGPLNVPVTMTVLPPENYGKLEGLVYSTGYCDEEMNPVEAGVVVENGAGMTWTQISDLGGYYSLWLVEDTYTVTASFPGHLDAMGVVDVVAGMTTTQDLALRLLAPCMNYEPAAFSVNMLVDNQRTEMLTIYNDGAGDLRWEVLEAYTAGGPWQDVPWVSEVPANGVVTGDDVFDVDVIFDSTGLALDQCYTATLGLLHDDPVVASPSYIPLELCVVDCLAVEGVDLVQVTPDPIYPGNDVLFQADILPDGFSGPYSYTITFGDGEVDTGTSSDDPLVLTHAYAIVNTYTVEIEVWNCDMTEPVVGSDEVVVQPRLQYYLPIILRNYE